MPQREGLTNHTYINASPECWNVYGEVLAKEYSNPALFAAVHRLTVDTYAVQHPGGVHPDKSIDGHLVALHHIHVRGRSYEAAMQGMKRVIESKPAWPHFDPPPMPLMTVFDVAMASSPEEHAALVREWSNVVWRPRCDRGARR